MNRKRLGASSEGQLDRDIQIHKDVYALGVCIFDGKAQDTARTVLEEMHGMDWVPVPYSLARAMQDAITVAVYRKLPYAAGQPLAGLDEEKGVLQLTQLGQMAVDKLKNKISSMI